MPGGEGGDLDYKLWGPWELPALMADTVTGRRSFFLSSSTLWSALGTCLALPYGGTRPWVAGGCSRDGQGSAGTKLEHGLCLLLTVSLWARYLTFSQSLENGFWQLGPSYLLKRALFHSVYTTDPSDVILAKG